MHKHITASIFSLFLFNCSSDTLDEIAERDAQSQSVAGSPAVASPAQQAGSIEDYEHGHATVFAATLDPSQEIPSCANGSPDAIGQGVLAISADRRTIELQLAHRGLSGAPTAGHIHIGSRKDQGPIALDFSADLSSPIRGRITAAQYKPRDKAPPTFEDLLTEIEQENSYFNLHTKNCPTGEIRGQISVHE